MNDNRLGVRLPFFLRAVERTAQPVLGFGDRIRIEQTRFSA
jgi:hypothetical protein